MANEKRLIDLDKLIKPYKALAQLDPYEYIPPKMIVEELENQPRVDAVEVVRCKDCKKDWCYLRQELGPVGFCSAGEMKP